MAILDVLSRNFVKYDKYITDENNLLLDILQDALHGTNNASTENLFVDKEWQHGSQFILSHRMALSVESLLSWRSGLISMLKIHLAMFGFFPPSFFLLYHCN